MIKAACTAISNESLYRIFWEKIYLLSQIQVALSPFTYIPITHEEIPVSLRKQVLLSRIPMNSSEEFGMRLTSKDISYILFSHSLPPMISFQISDIN